jgi:K+-transporting ATPase ATPase A chain
MNWCQYAAILLFNGAGLVVLFALLMSQGALPLPPASVMGSGAEYGGELCQQHQLAGLCRRKHHEYLSQMAGLTVQNFLSAATGIAIFALTRASESAPLATPGSI